MKSLQFKSQYSEKTKYEKIFLRWLPVNRFLAITLRVNENCYEKCGCSAVSLKLNAANILLLREVFFNDTIY